MKWYEKILILIFICSLLILIGCAAMQDAITPCTIENKTVNYAMQVDPNLRPTSWMPWTTLRDAERIEGLVDYAHIGNQIFYERMKEDDSRLFDYITERQSIHKQAAVEFRKEVFTPEGAVGAVMLSGLSILLGKYGFARPSDIREIEKLKNGGTEKPVNS